MENQIFYINRKIIDFFLKHNNTNADNSLDCYVHGLDIVKYHTEHLAETGDLSISSIAVNWMCFSQRFNMEFRHEIAEIMTDNAEIKGDTLLQLLQKDGATWLLPVARVKLLPNARFALYFERSVAKRLILKRVLFGNNDDVAADAAAAADAGAEPAVNASSLPYGYFKKNPKRLLYLAANQLSANADHSLNDFRAKLLSQILQRLFERSSYTVINDAQLNDIANAGDGQLETVVQVRIRSSGVNAPMLNDDKSHTIIVGPVLEPTTKKLCTMRTEDYIALRSNDMLLMAMHKYAVRGKASGDFVDKRMSTLGKAAVTVDMFEVRASTPIRIVRSGMGSTKGASFVLYNSARLETLLRNYDERVVANELTALPNFNDIDLDLLNEEDEWQLIFSFLQHYPNLIERAIEKVSQGQCAVHLIVRYINDLVSLFSGYYKRKQILMKRPNMMPLVHARLYLIKAVRYLLNDTLAVLGIEPVQFM